jgi:formate dehydrogenase accessory protein FdhD
MVINPQNFESSQAGPKQVYEAAARDQDGNPCRTFVPAENPLIIRLNHTEIATLMTIGTHPRELALEKIYESPLTGGSIHPSTLFELLKNLHNYNAIYRKAGSVHGCALCRQSSVLIYIEDIGRHNAADVISGKMLIEGITADDKILYTTGRVTSEIVIKSAIMKIPILVSKSGVTSMGLELAKDLGITLVTRARDSRYLIYNEAGQ